MADRSSYDSAQVPLSNVQYQSTNNPNTHLHSSEPYYNESGYYPSPAKKQGLSPWVKFGLPVLLLVIAGAVVGGVVGSRSHHKNASVSSAGGGGSNPAAASSAVNAKNAIGIFPMSTDSYELPVYPSTVSPIILHVWIGILKHRIIYRRIPLPSLSQLFKGPASRHGPQTLSPPLLPA
jgi:hypothetical protein